MVGFRKFWPSISAILSQNVLECGAFEFEISLLMESLPDGDLPQSTFSEFQTEIFRLRNRFKGSKLGSKSGKVLEKFCHQFGSW